MPERNYKVTVEPDRVMATISKHLFGACLEDVNHEVYGGIYAQMLFGESFEEEPMIINPEEEGYRGLTGSVSCLAEREHLKGRSEIRSWQPFRTGDAIGHFAATPLHCRLGRQSQRIEHKGGNGTVGIENRGLNRWGLSVKADRPYECTLVLSAQSKNGAANVKISASLENAEGTIYDKVALEIPVGWEFHTLHFSLTPNKSDDCARFAIHLEEQSTVWVDYALLHPGFWGRYKNTMARVDIADFLANEGLTVLRYGGCMINTDYIHTEIQVPGSGYRWKKMIGPRSLRPPYRGTFYRYNSNGFGIIDFISLCKDLGIECVPAVCAAESPEDLADLIQYVNGSIDTYWGGKRAAYGFPEPFRLRYLQIGNEERDLVNGKCVIRESYVEKLRSQLEAIHKADSTVMPIVSIWLYSKGDIENPVNENRIKLFLEAVRGFSVLMDIHIGGDGLLDAHRAADGINAVRTLFDDLEPDNRIKFCVLEENGGRHDIQRALGHAHNIMTIERQGLIEIDCPANCLQPWLENDNSWDQGQVFFTSSKVWAMPPYYAQRMLAENHLPICVSAHTDAPSDIFDVTATRDEQNGIHCLKLLNLSCDTMNISVDYQNMEFHGSATVETLSGDLNAENVPDQPEAVLPVVKKILIQGNSFELSLPPYSFNVIRYSR